MIQIEQLVPGQTEYIDQVFHLIQMLSATTSLERVKQAVASSCTFIFIALDTTTSPTWTVVGTTTLATTFCLTGLRSHIEDVMVDPSWRRQGIAQQLIQAAIDYAQTTLHVKTIDLTSRPTREAANALYKKLGFVERDTNTYRYLPPSP
jgi:ribosomal protein S18 acetylase RimI-like enzyme